MAKHGSIGEFDSDRETWKSYTEQLTQYFAANDVESADKQHAILLSVCGPPPPHINLSGTFWHQLSLLKSHFLNW